jgi:dTDP-4-dehydrorhamnose reductase
MLITGGSGKLGKELMKVFPEALHPTRQELDIQLKDQIEKYISENKPEIIIHAAALTDVCLCEENKMEAFEVNVVGTRNLVNACENLDSKCYFVFISTACVFYGDKGNYVETDMPNPKNWYAFTKLRAEDSVKYSGLKHLIVRTNFVARSKSKWPFPAVFTDRYGTYLYADQVAKAIKRLVEDRLVGVIHVCGKKRISMYELARRSDPDVKPMTLADYTGRARLTRDMSLRSVRLEPIDIET